MKSSLTKRVLADHGFFSESVEYAPSWRIEKIEGVVIHHAPLDFPPPNTIPETKYNEFTLNGKISTQSIYYDASSGCLAPTNTAQDYKRAFEQLEEGTFKYVEYGDEVYELYDAFDKYDLKDKTVLVWGLAGLNCEAIALWKGASKVYVVDYNKPTCEHEKIVVLSHEELEKSGIKTDFAISFSSFEHDGLGQYGDPINPTGDFNAMQKAKKYLKDKGILFLGVPMGKDCLVWNAHRIYGEIRLPLLLKGWACIDVFNFYGDVSADFPFDMPLGAVPQPLLVLENISTDFPEDEWFEAMLGRLAPLSLERPSLTGKEFYAANTPSSVAAVNTCSPRLLKRITELLYAKKRETTVV